MSNRIPSGSYQLTSKEIIAHLYCEAQKRDQSWIPAGYSMPHKGDLNIANIDGHLINEPGDAPTDSYVPGGCYLLTTKSRTVILSALCQKIDQSWQWSGLNITNLNLNATISNIDGVLTVD